MFATQADARGTPMRPLCMPKIGTKPEGAIEVVALAYCLQTWRRSDAARGILFFIFNGAPSRMKLRTPMLLKLHCDFQDSGGCRCRRSKASTF
jgi:hypothetical protein